MVTKVAGFVNLHLRSAFTGYLDRITAIVTSQDAYLEFGITDLGHGAPLAGEGSNGRLMEYPWQDSNLRPYA